ncbi:hypothetical protein GQX74_005219 [Glossina fuscipes]|nr:hypothetical protein GQX74_005219 [Glossina fuscipes]
MPNLTKRDTSKLDEFGSLDYKQPMPKQQDMRTSTYLGNRYINDTMYGNKIHAKINESRHFVEDEVLVKQRTSDYKANYVWKFADPYEDRNPTLPRKMENMKTCYEMKLKFLKRPMQPATSVTRSDFSWNPEHSNLAPVYPLLPAPVGSTIVTVDRNMHGYSKYLDPQATTQRLDYCYRSPNDIMQGIGAHDNITFWNWKDIELRRKNVFRHKDVQQCDKFAADECVKRRCEFASQVKSVPYSGMTTEVRQNYIEPIKTTIDYDTSHFQNDLVYEPADQLPKKTEYSILGSGEQYRVKNQGIACNFSSVCRFLLNLNNHNHHRQRHHHHHHHHHHRIY